METLVLDGKTFVKASKAARDLGYTADYVGQLCRGGKIASHLVGRTWYVDVSGLGVHQVEKKRMSRVKAREQAHKAIEEHIQLRVQSDEGKATRITNVRYEDDSSELIPTVRKLEIEEEVRKAPVRKVEKEDSAPYVLENAGKKILMSGKLSVIDVSEEVIDDGTVLLQPRIMKKAKVAKATLSKIDVEPEENTAITDEVVIDTQPKSFTEKLDLLSEDEEQTEPAFVEVPVLESAIVPKQKQRSSWFMVLFLIAFLALILASTGVSRTWAIISDEKTGNVGISESSFGFDIEKVLMEIF